jgi:hypothetical protein
MAWLGETDITPYVFVFRTATTRTDETGDATA